MKVGVLGLQGDVREHLSVLESIGATAVIVRRAEELDDVDGLVVPGGESTTIGKLMERFGILAAVRERAGDGFPLFGTCAGMILMAAEVVGPPPPHLIGVMDVSLCRNAYGRQVDSFEATMTWGREQIRGAFIRAPMVEKVGDGVEVLARYEERPTLVREGRLLATTFHPEVVGEDRVHRMFLELISES